MVYLIGGPPRSGKTTLAKKLAARLRIGWVPVDFLEGIVREGLSANKRRELFPKNALRDKTDGTNDEMYSRFSFQEIAQAYTKQGQACSKAIESFVGECALEEHDFILEGYQIRPVLAAKLMRRFPKEVRGVFLIKKDEAKLVEGFTKNAAQKDWVLQKTQNPETLGKIAKMLSFLGARIEREANECGLPVYCLDDNFPKHISSLVRGYKTFGATKRVAEAIR